MSKHDNFARHLFPSGSYDKTPKSAFATLAYYLAERLDGGDGSDTTTPSILIQELDALVENELIRPAQAKALLSAMESSHDQ